MARLDLSPLFRSSVGFDHLASMLDSANRIEQPAYPPYNIERVSDDKYCISMAVAGFDSSELQIESERNTLKVSGVKESAEEIANICIEVSLHATLSVNFSWQIM